jgi:hypothetical protein
MKLTHRIADWLTGREFSHAKRDVVWWRDHMVDEVYGPLLDDRNREVIELQSRLDRIAGMETPNCAHIGKKMARVARGEE